MIKAIIFDCYGVLTSEGWLPFKRKHFSHDTELDQEAHDLMKQVDAGFMGYQEFVTRVSDMARVSYQFAARQIFGNQANDELFDYIAKELKPHYKIGLLSNAGSNKLDELFSPEQTALFDAVGLSYEIGTAKPNREAYTHILEKLGVSAEEAVFIDDQLRHCSGARDAGLHAIVYKDFEQLKTELNKLLKQKA